MLFTPRHVISFSLFWTEKQSSATEHENTNEHGIIAMYRVVHSIKLVRLHSYQVEELNKQTICARTFRMLWHVANGSNSSSSRKKNRKVNQSRPIWKPSIAQNDGMLQSDWVPIGLNQNQEQTIFFSQCLSLSQKKTCSLFFRQAFAHGRCSSFLRSHCH